MGPKLCPSRKTEKSDNWDRIGKKQQALERRPHMSGISDNRIAAQSWKADMYVVIVDYLMNSNI